MGLSCEPQMGGGGVCDDFLASGDGDAVAGCLW